MKRLIILYALAVGMVIVYFILSIFFTQDKAIELRHFNTIGEPDENVQKDAEATKKEESKPEQRFMLLPQK